MKMQDLENKKIRIGKTSITVIGDNEKTAEQLALENGIAVIHAEILA